MFVTDFYIEKVTGLIPYHKVTNATLSPTSLSTSLLYLIFLLPKSSAVIEGHWRSLHRKRIIEGNFPYKSIILSVHNNHPIHFDLTLLEPNSDFPFGQLNGTKNYSRTVFKIQICILPRCSRTWQNPTSNFRYVSTKLLICDPNQTFSTQF